MSPKQVFVREATGLVREVSGWASLLGNWGCVTSGVPIMVMAYLYTAAGAVWPVAWILGFLPSLSLAILYVVISSSMPRSGSDYVFATRALNPFIGFVNCFGLVVINIFTFAVICYFGATYFGYLFSSLGVVYNWPDMTSLGAYILNPTPIFIISALIIVIGGIFAAIPARRGWSFIYWCGITTLISMAVFFFVLASISTSTFKSAFDAFAASQNLKGYDAIISTAGLSSPGWFSATFTALPFVWFAYASFNMPAAWAGETKNIQRSAWVAIAGAVVLAAAFYMLFTGLIFRAFGQNFLEAWSAISSAGFVNVGWSTSLGVSPVSGVGNFVPFFAFVVYQNPILLFIMFIALWLPIFYQIPVYVVYTTRYIFAWAWDRILPERFAAVNERFHTPLLATLITIGGAIIVVFLATFVPESSVVLSTPSLYTIGFMIPCIAAMVFPYTQKNLYETSLLVKRKVAGIPVIVWLGAVTLVYLIASTYLAIASGSLLFTPDTGATYLIIYSLGAIIFAYGYYNAKRKGIPIDLAFKQIPPE